MQRRKASWIALLLFVLLLAPASFAQEATAIERLEIAFWPEYDQPAVLVIYRITLPAGTPLPAQVSVSIPAAVGEPLAVAWVNAAGDLLLAQYERQVQGEWATIRLTTESLQAQLEYYAELPVDAQIRRFTFTWPGGQALGALAYEFQEPSGAREVTISPAATDQRVAGSGLTLRSAELGPQAADAQAEIRFSYERSTSQLSVQPEVPQEETTKGSTPDLRTLVPWVAGGLGVVLLAAGGYWWLRLRNEEHSSRARRRRSERKRRRDEQGEVDASPVYCHNCGTLASVSDHFCRRCGTQLRR
ncbi:MAG TPA: zinc ribbon domain-containing protein [Anaerolineales bacterium]|nr:zinc ribbon domain-containing protein [Anaerolineales bacterium]